MQAVRLRRLRRNRLIRDWLSQTRLGGNDFIVPYFVIAGKKLKKPIKSMPGVYHFSIDCLLQDIQQLPQIPAILLFGLPKVKDELASRAYAEDGIVQQALRAVKKRFKNLIVITDACLCAYSAHGHCGFINQKSAARSQKSGLEIDNDATLEILAKIALSHARAGADFVAPSAMMDGQVRAIRRVLDGHGFGHVGILAYSAKYASNFYGPFREAQGSSPQFGDRRSYQMDFRNSDQALREVEQDIAEGADIVMVKPALAYLDIIYRVKERFNIPIAAYNVSAEYSMVKAFSQITDNRKQKTEIEKKLALEMLTAIKRAGADFIISYWAKQVVEWLKH